MYATEMFSDNHRFFYPPRQPRRTKSSRHRRMRMKDIWHTPSADNLMIVMIQVLLENSEVISVYESHPLESLGVPLAHYYAPDSRLILNLCLSAVCIKVDMYNEYIVAMIFQHFDMWNDPLDIVRLAITWEPSRYYKYLHLLISLLILKMLSTDFKSVRTPSDSK